MRFGIAAEELVYPCAILGAAAPHQGVERRGRGLPHSVPHSVPHPVPHPVPHSVPHSVPHPVPHPVPHSVPHSVPHPVPHSGPQRGSGCPVFVGCGIGKMNMTALQRLIALRREDGLACNTLAAANGPLRDGLGERADACRCNGNRAGSRLFGSEKYMALHVLSSSVVRPYELPVHGLAAAWSGCTAGAQRSKTGAPCAQKVQSDDLAPGNGTHGRGRLSCAPRHALRVRRQGFKR